MSPSLLRTCPNCGQELTLDALACPRCHALLHGVELDAMAREAKALEGSREWVQARELWNRSLPLLPPDSKQAEWVRDHLRALELRHSEVQQAQANPVPPWVRRLGPLAPIVLVLAKSKGLLLALFKLKFLFSFFSFLAIYVAIFGWRFGVGFAVCLFLHEMGHYIDIKRRGLPAEMPVFLPGLGAYVRWNALGVSRRQIAQVSLAGPLAGWIAAACCLLLYHHTHDLLWASLARTGAVINVLNLIPVWVLDGGQAVRSLGLVERVGLLAAALALWALTGEGIFFLVAAGATYRLFTKDKPAQDDWSTWLYFVAVLGALALILQGTPESLFEKLAH